MINLRTVTLLAIALQVAVITMPDRVAHASHASYVVQPIYFFSSDMSNDFNSYQSKLNSFMAVTNSWYANAHLSSGDNFQMNSITWRQGNQTKAQYCSPASVSSCLISDVYTKVWNYLASGNIYPSPLGYNPSSAKNVITVVFFDNIGPTSANPWGLGQSQQSAIGSYNPEGYGGIVMINDYVLDKSANSGQAGTVAHELGLRIAHAS